LHSDIVVTIYPYDLYLSHTNVHNSCTIVNGKESGFDNFFSFCYLELKERERL
jgi:hypothetical protein